MRQPFSSCSRRRFIASSVGGTLGLALSPTVQRLLAAQGPTRRAKACILLWLNGGPSHLDTFDPKPGAETGGPFEAIETSVSGIRICQQLPRLAKQAQHLAIIRSLTSKEADHGRANYFLHTGNNQQATTEFPAIGSVVARSWSAEETDLPAFVLMGNAGFDNSPGFFGLDFAPYRIDDPNQPAPNSALPEGTDGERQSRRLAALKKLNGGFAQRLAQPVAADHASSIAKALRLMNGAGLKAFDLAEESPETRAAYGAGDEPNFARQCLLARRLVERGVRFVELVLDGWDTHGDNFNAVTGLCGQLDGPFAALVADLAERGLLEHTLVICMGEFGRTPAINGNNGRDHWSDAFSAVLA
ncbi:MAG: DUF1501 domain-containing protein, partial [Candidatus Saccharimonadales bacterium]